MFKRDSYRKSTGGEEGSGERKKRFSLGRGSSAASSPSQGKDTAGSPSVPDAYTPTRRIATPSRIPAPAPSPSSSTKKRSLSGIFRSKSKRDLEISSPISAPSTGGKSKASPSTPSIGRALPLPSPSPKQGQRDDYFAKTPTKTSSKPLPLISEQARPKTPERKPANLSREPVTVPSPTHRRIPSITSDLSSPPSAGLVTPAPARIAQPNVTSAIAKHFSASADSDNHDHLRKLAARKSTPPDSTDSSSVRTFGSRTRPSPPELGEVYLSKPGVATQQVDLKDAVPVHVGSSTDAEYILERLEGRGRGGEREESLRKALGTSPSTWDLDQHSSRTLSPAPSTSSPRRSIPASPVVSKQTAERYLKAKLATPTKTEAEAQAAVEAAIYSTPLEVSPPALSQSSRKLASDLTTAESPSDTGVLTEAAAQLPASREAPASSFKELSTMLQPPEADSAIISSSREATEAPTASADTTVSHEVDGHKGENEAPHDEVVPAPAESGSAMEVRDSQEGLIPVKGDPRPLEEPTADAITGDHINEHTDGASDSEAVQTPSPSTPHRTLSFTGPFASAAQTPSGSRKIPLPALPPSTHFAPAPYNDMVPSVLQPKMAVEIDFTQSWIPAVRGGWVDKPGKHQRGVSEQVAETQTERQPRKRVTSWVGSVPVVGWERAGCG